MGPGSAWGHSEKVLHFMAFTGEWKSGCNIYQNLMQQSGSMKLLISVRGTTMLNIMTLSIPTLSKTIRKCDVLHNNFGTKDFVFLSLFFLTPFPTRDLSHFRKNVTFKVLALL